MSRSYNSFYAIPARKIADMLEAELLTDHLREECKPVQVATPAADLPVLYVEAIIAEYDDSADPRTESQREQDDHAAEVIETQNSNRPGGM